MGIFIMRIFASEIWRSIEETGDSKSGWNNSWLVVRWFTHLKWRFSIAMLVGYIYIYILVGGDWNHGIFHDFPFSWEFHHPNWRSPSFFRGVEETTNQCHFGRVQLGHHGCHLPPFFFASAILVASSHIHWLGETMKPRLVKIEALKTPPVLWVFWVYYL